MPGPSRSESSRRNARWLVPALLIAWWSSPALAATQPPVSAPAAALASAAPVQTTGAPGIAAGASHAQGYAEREARELEQWSGGDYGGGVFISGTVLVIALIVALFLLILR